MASRVRVAASACLVASGLLIAGAGGAMALADPEHGHGQSDDHQGDDSLGDVIRRGPGTDAGNDQQGDSGTGQRPQPQWGNGRDDEDPDEGDTTKPTKTPPSRTTTKTPPSDTTTNTPPSDTTKTTTSETTPTPPGKPPPPPPVFSGGGGGGGAVIPLPHFTPPNVPGMQLPGELQPSQPGVPGGAAVLDAGAGAVAVAPVGPAAPIALPVIVVPPVGLGAGAGGLGSPGAPPGLPRALSAEPPAARVSPPANLGSNAAVPASSYRIGYTEYLRTAGLPQVAALAVPGLAGILVLTGAGGLVGYRQAKAGHTVRVGSTARFMR